MFVLSFFFIQARSLTRNIDWTVDTELVEFLTDRKSNSSKLKFKNLEKKTFFNSALGFEVELKWVPDMARRPWPEESPIPDTILDQILAKHASFFADLSGLEMMW